MKNKIHNESCIETLAKIETGSLNMVFADPPFNVGKKYGQGSDKRIDYYEWCEAWISECFRALSDNGTFYLMTIDRHLERLFPMMGARGTFVSLVKWRNVAACQDKKRFWVSTQPILVYGKTKNYKFHTYAQTRKIEEQNLRWGGYSTEPKGQLLDYWDDIPFVYAGSICHREAILKPGANKKAHPCQMPEALAVRCIVFSTDEGDTVYDPFMGSGTTAAACCLTGRNFIGSEEEGEYFELANERLRGGLFSCATSPSLL